jgi:hypothetical protein
MYDSVGESLGEEEEEGSKYGSCWTLVTPPVSLIN